MAELLTDWRDVPGWLSDAEGEALRMLAAGARVLEIGSYLGRSTVAMAQVAREVVALDWHRGDEHAGRIDTLPRFWAHLGRAGVRDKVTVLVAPIREAARFVYGCQFDLVFVDAAHDEATTREATELATACLMPGGAIAWHDYDRAPVRAAIRSLGLAPEGLAGSLAWLRLSPEHRGEAGGDAAARSGDAAPPP